MQLTSIYSKGENQGTGPLTLEKNVRGDLQITLHEEAHQPDWPEDTALHMREILHGPLTGPSIKPETPLSAKGSKPDEVFMPQVLPEGITRGRSSARHQPAALQSIAPETQENERRVYEGHPSLMNFVTSILTSAGTVTAGVMLLMVNPLILIGGIGLSVMTMARILIMRRCWSYIITERRVEMVYGIFNRSSEEVRIKDIRNINVRREGLRGLMGVGDVEIASAGGGEVEVIFKGVWRPHVVKQLIRTLQDQAPE